MQMILTFQIHPGTIKLIQSDNIAEASIAGNRIYSLTTNYSQVLPTPWLFSLLVATYVYSQLFKCSISCNKLIFLIKWKSEMCFIGRGIVIIVSSWPLEPQLILISCPNRFRIMTWQQHFVKKKLKIHGNLTLRRLMSYIYGAPILDVSRSRTTTQHSR